MIERHLRDELARRGRDVRPGDDPLAELRTDRRLRAAVLRAVLREDAAIERERSRSSVTRPRARSPLDRHVLSLSDPDVFSAYIDAFVVVRGHDRLRAAIAAGLLHPRADIARRALVLHRDGRAADAPAPPASPVGITAEQRSQVPAWCERWSGWARRSAPADRAPVEDGMRRCYLLSGRRWHGRVVWLDSPPVAAMAARVVGGSLFGGGPVRLEVMLWSERIRGRDVAVMPPQYDDLRVRIDDEVRPRVDPGALFELDGQMLGRTEGPVPLDTWAFEGWVDVRLRFTDDEETAELAERMRDQVARETGRRPGAAPPDRVSFGGPFRWGWQFPGAHAAGWLARTYFLREVCGLDPGGSARDRLDAYRDANAAGVWWAYPDHVVVVERPELVRTDAAGRLHGADGPAIRWPDGTAIHAIDGVRLPADLVERGWPVERILDEPNAEVRRVAIERMGWDRFVREARLALVDGPVADPGNPGNTLSLYDLPAPPRGAAMRVLLCTNATPRRDGTLVRFGLHVPATVGDALAAAAWTFDVDPETYRRLSRAT